MNTLDKIKAILEQDGHITTDRPKADQYGFYGDRTAFGGIKNVIVDAIVDSWEQSPIASEAQAGREFPRNFVFFTNQEQHDSLSEDMQLLYNKNHNKRLSIRNIVYRYEDENNKPVPDHCIISLGNNNYPKTRQKNFNLRIEYFVNRWLWLRSQDIKGNGGLNFKK